MKNNSKGKELIKNTAIVAIGKISTQFISFFLLPLYTAILSTKEYGVVDLLNTYVFLIIPIVFLQIDQAIFRFLIDVRKNEDYQKKLISTTIFTVIIQSLLFIILFLLGAIFIKNEYKYFLIINVVATMFSNILLQISRGIGDNKTYSIGSLISGSFAVVFNVLFIVFLHLGAYGMLLATFLANILCSCYIFFKKEIYKFIKIKYFNYKDLKEMWKYSLPLVPNQLSWWVINASDRTIITTFLGITFNGVYSAANKFSSVCITLFNIFNITWSESASVHIKDEDSSQFFSNIFNISIKLFTCLCLGIIAIMPFVFNFLITGKGYEEAYFQIPLLMIATIFNISVSLIGAIYVALKKSNEIAKTSIYSAIINIFINLILVKYLGLYAASLSTLLAYFLMSVYRYLDVQKYIKIKIDKLFVSEAVLLLIIILISYYLKNNFICVIILISTIIFSIKSNFKTIYQFLTILRKKICK